MGLSTCGGLGCPVDADGVASITANVPLIARGQGVLFQACVQDECAISQLVAQEFE